VSVAKELVKRAFHAAGLEVRKMKQDPNRERTTFTGALRQIAKQGFKPKTVIDVGVAYQTAELYQEFPEANILLIEPLVEFEPFLQQICASYKAQYVLAAAGAAPGSAVLNVHSDKIGSSMLREVEGPSVDGTPREVPVVTVDQLCAEKNLAGPYLLKVDVQGAELQVLDGARRTLEQTEAVLLELSFFGFYSGGPQFCDVIAEMKERGFVTYDVYGFLYRPLDNALSQVDVAFVREDGLFRKSHAYATAEQRRAITAQSYEPLLAASEKKRR
jgi:FkbM family methyltransferase